MDTSETYIKKSDCKEIQSPWQGLLKTDSDSLLPMGDSGDFVYCKSNHKIVVLYWNELHGSPPEKYLSPHTAIWLPRQDQLQEMVGGGQGFTFQTLGRFIRWHGKCIKDYLASIDSYPASMEQLWLAFVMKELHSKVWTGTEWA